MADDEPRMRDAYPENSGRPLGPRTSQCLSDTEAALLLGKADSNAERFLDHVAACDYCGARVRLLMANSDNAPENVSPEDDELISRMKSSSNIWQEQMAHRLEVAARHSDPKQSAHHSWSRVLWGGWHKWALSAGIVSLLSGAALFLQSIAGGGPEKLLAQAYTSHREFEWRLPDAGWSQRETQRGTIRERIPALLKAEAKLADDQGHENDPAWLDLRARAAMLRLSFEEAIQLLDKAASLDPKSTDFLADLAAAHGLNAEKTNPAEFGAAVEFATRALAIDPNQKRALYNRALALEQLHMVDAALEDWDKYMKVETDPAWLKDAREHADKLRAIQDQRAELLRSDEQSDAVLENKAMLWLKDDRAIAKRVGHLLLQKYGDRWLADAAEEQVNSQPLYEANQAMYVGSVDEAERLGSAGVRVYQANFAPAHLVRAQLERLNGLNRGFRAEECNAIAAQVAREADARGYPWIRAQALIQQSGCQQMRGDPGDASKLLVEATSVASKHELLGLRARAIGIEASNRTQDGDLWSAWRLNREALGTIAGSAYSPNRIQQCLVNYSDSADLWNWRHASYWFMRAAAEIAHSTPNRIAEAAQRARAAYLASAAGLDSAYDEEARLAEGLFNAQPDSETRTRYLNEAKLLEGQHLLRAGQPANAAGILRPVAEHAILQNDRRDAYQLLGMSLLRSEGRSSAIPSLRTAVNILDRTVATLHRVPERSTARRGGIGIFRTLASLLSEDPASQPEALQLWLAAHGSEHAPDIVFLALEHGYAVWTGNGSHVARLDLDRTVIRRSIARLLRAAADPKSSPREIEEEGRFLYDRLWKDVAPSVHSDRVTVLPDEELAALPFSLLVDEHGHWLTKTVVLSAHEPIPESWTRPRNAVVIGSPATREDLSPLPDSRREAEDIASRFPGSVPLIGANATSSAVEQQLANADLFHFSGHGYAGSTVAGLYLSDALLTSVSLQNVSLPRCRLAVLSACFTAVGEDEGLTNPDSLVHALLDAGARTVIASRWNVDSAATATLMSRFYSNLPTSGDPAQALRSASVSLRETPAYTHPYYWAAFQTYQ